MPGDFLPIAVLIIMATGLAFIIMLLGQFFGPRRPNPRKGSPYESGMRPYGKGQRQVPVHFYLIAVLFIIFDIEIVFLLPWAVVLRDLDLVGLLEMGLFIAILLIGLSYAWKKGALEWE